MVDSQPMNETMRDLVKICNQSNVSTTYKHFILNLILIIVSCKILHLILRYFDQPRIVSEFFVGLLSANIPPLSLSAQVLRPFKQLEFVASTAYMFVLGLEMEPTSILNPPGPEAVIAYTGIIASVLITLVTNILVHLGSVHTATDHQPRVLAVFTLVFAATSSPLVTRLTTELKLGKSEIGRRAIRASLTNDMVCTLLMCFLFVFRGSDGAATGKEVLIIIGFLMGEMAIILLVVRPVLRWVNNRNPEGQRMNAVHMVATVVLTQMLCYVSHWFGYDTKVNSFLVGLALPREGRVSNILISKINYVLATFVLPLFFSMANIQLNPKMWADKVDGRGKHGISWLKLIYIFVNATVGKLFGTFVAGKYFGLHWLEAVTLAVLLNVKGYLQVFFTFHSKRQGLINENSTIVMVFAVMASIIFAPLIVSFIVRHVRSKGTSSLRLMGLQWYDPTTVLRVMVGLHGPQNVPAAANMVEMLRGGTTAGIEVNTVDMVRLTEHAATSLVYRQGMDAVMVADDNVVHLREQIGAALDAYMPAAAAGVAEGSSRGGAKEAGMNLKRILAISSFDNMHEDICCGAADNMVVLVILPFHKAQRVDGRMDAGDPGFRMVNQNVLQRASCSVGILVDRGIGKTSNMSLSNASLNVAAVFTGGADGREALAYAACIARHPGIRLMVIRFLPDKEAIAMAAGPGRRILTAVTDEDKKMKVDDDYFAGFYEQHIANKGVGYMEKHVINGVEAVATLRLLEGSYQLFIVGKGREQDSMLTAGMSERAECPELGPIGDILASSDFSVTASVLVIQQYDTTKDFMFLGDEFMPL